MRPDAILKATLALLDDNKARDIVTIPLAGKSAIADYMVIATGTSSRQLAALADNLATTLKKMGEPATGIEGKSGGDWILIDAGDVIIHLFREETRAIYQLEKMWGDGEPAGDTEAVKISAAPHMAGDTASG